MNNELLAVLDHLEREKGIARQTLLDAVEEALTAAARKMLDPSREVRVAIDPDTGEFKALSSLEVSEEVVNDKQQIGLEAARGIRPQAEIGDRVEVEVPPHKFGRNFGRIATQNAKQALMAQLRRAEKDQIQVQYQDRIGDIVVGKVLRFEQSDVILDLGRFEGILPNRERVPSEEYQPGERLRCYVKSIDDNFQGPDIVLSRSDPDFVIKLFKLEVSEINDGTIEIKSIARDPGYRTKLAVWSNNPKVDPVGACVGLRGQRVKNIVRELNNEKVDIIPWNEDQRAFVANALSPVKLLEFHPEPMTRRIRVLVDPEQLSLAIGKKGQNARLTSRLCGCHIDIQAHQVAEFGFEEKKARAIDSFASIDGITREQASTLVNSGFHSLEDLLQAELSDLQEIPDLGESASHILQSAKAESTRRLLKLEEI